MYAWRPYGIASLVLWAESGSTELDVFPKVQWEGRQLRSVYCCVMIG